MAFDPDQFLAQTASAPAQGFDPDKFLAETEPKSIGGFAQNAWEDVKETSHGVGSLMKGIVTHPIDTAVNTATHLPGALAHEAKRIGLVGDGGFLSTEAPFVHPIDAAQKMGGAFYDKPLTTGFDILSMAAPMSKAASLGKLGEMAKPTLEASEAAQAGAKIGSVADELGQAAKTGGVADDLARVAPAASEPLNLGSEAANILKEGPGSSAAGTGATGQSVRLGPTFQDTVANLGEAVGEKIPGSVKGPLQQVGDFLGSKYAQVAKKPGWKDTLADYMKENSQNLDLKEMGAAPGQVRKIGVDRAHELADYAAKNGLVDTKIGTIGREKLIMQRLDEAGGAVGAFRKMAADRGAVVNPDELINQIRSKLDDKYLTAGLHSGEKGTYMKALMELKKSSGSANDLADKVSELFQESKNLDRLKRPSGPVADVARAAREANHQMIASKLSPEEMAVYEKGLEDYGALTQIKEFVKRRGSTEAGGRLGPGSGISRAAVQKFLDAVGYRTQAKIMRNLSEKIRTNPEIAAKPQNIFRHYIDEAADAIDEMGEAAQ